MYNSFNRFQDTASPAKNLEYENPNFESGSKNRIKNFFYLWPLLFLILALLFAIVMMHYNSSVQNSNFEEAHDAVNTLSANLNKKFIEDIKTVKETETCPAGFKHENVGKFYGTDSGCLCSDGSVHSRSYCWFKSSNECKYSSEMSEKPFKAFLNTKFCVKHLAAVTHETSPGHCPATHPKRCPDTVCVAESGKCQVTSIVAAEGAADASAGELALGTTHKLTLKRDDPKTSLVGFNSQISNTPCSALNKKRPQTASKKAYPLDSVKTTGCGKYGDMKTMTKLVASEKLDTFYKQNELSAVTTNLPFHTHYYTESDKMNLYSEYRVPVPDTKECHKLDSKGIDEYSNGAAHVMNCIHVLGVIIIVLAAIGIVLSILFLILRHKLAFLNNRGVLYAIYGLAIIVAICCIILFALYTHNTNEKSLNSSEAKFEQEIKHKCFHGNPGFEKAAQDVLSANKHIHSNTGYLIKTLFAAAIIFLVICLVAVGLRKAKKMAPLPDPRA